MRVKTAKPQTGALRRLTTDNMAVCMGAKPVETFVFLDLETTGLGSPGARPRIVELSMVATHRSQLMAHSRSHEPRVLNKLTLCVYPMKPMDPGASTITGLYNDSLLCQKDFDENFVTCVQLFLARLLPPVCLVAHNGNNYDFGLLRSELGCLDKALSDDIMCVDSLVLWRDLDSREPELMATENRTIRKYLDFKTDVPGLSVNGPGPSGVVCKKAQVLQATPCKSDVNGKHSSSNPALVTVCDNVAMTCDMSAEAKDKEFTSCQGNVKKKQKTFHPRKLFTGGPSPSPSTTDFNGNDTPVPQVTSTGSPEGLPLMEDPFVSSNQDDGLDKQKCDGLLLTGNSRKGNGSVSRSQDTSQRTVRYSQVDEGNAKESDSESDTDTILVIGDAESETMSTLQAMPTFRYSSASWDSLSSRFPSFTSDRQESIASVVDSQRTEAYSILDQSAPTDSSQAESVSILVQRAAPIGSQESVSDEEMLQLVINNDSENIGNSVKAESQRRGENRGIVRRSQGPADCSQVQLGSQNTLDGFEISDSILGQMTLPSQSKPDLGGSQPDNLPGLGEGMPSNELRLGGDLAPAQLGNPMGSDGRGMNRNDKSPSRSPQSSSPPPKSPENRPVPLEILQEIHKLGTHAPKKKPKPPPKFSYKLANLHQRILGYEPPASHNAEDDAMAILRIFHRRAMDVLPWCDEHAIQFNNIPFMYPVQQRDALPEGVFPKDV